MTHQQAAAKSRFGFALRVDISGAEGRLVLYNHHDSRTLIAVDEAGEMWRLIDTARCSAYLDWEPAPDTAYEKWRRFWRLAQRVWPRWLWLAALLACALGQAHSQEMRRVTWKSYRVLKGDGWEADMPTSGGHGPCVPLLEAERDIPQRLTNVEGEERYFYRLEPCGPEIPWHARRRACIGFTAGWCDDSYSTKEVYEIWTAGMRVYWPDMHEEIIVQLQGRGWPPWPPRRFPYTICLGYLDVSCDVAFPIHDDVCYEMHQHVVEQNGLDVAVKLRGVLDCLPNWEHVVWVQGVPRN